MFLVKWYWWQIRFCFKIISILTSFKNRIILIIFIHRELGEIEHFNHFFTQKMTKTRRSDGEFIYWNISSSQLMKWNFNKLFCCSLLKNVITYCFQIKCKYLRRTNDFIIVPSCIQNPHSSTFIDLKRLNLLFYYTSFTTYIEMII